MSQINSGSSSPASFSAGDPGRAELRPAEHWLIRAKIILGALRASPGPRARAGVGPGRPTACASLLWYCHRLAVRSAAPKGARATPANRSHRARLVGGQSWGAARPVTYGRGQPLAGPQAASAVAAEAIMVVSGRQQLSAAAAQISRQQAIPLMLFGDEEGIYVAQASLWLLEGARAPTPVVVEAVTAAVRDACRQLALWGVWASNWGPPARVEGQKAHFGGHGRAAPKRAGPRRAPVYRPTT